MAPRSSSKRKVARRKSAATSDAAALQAGLDKLPIGFALFDAKRRLIAWNNALASIYGYPQSFLAVGTPVEHFLRFNAQRGDYGHGQIAALVRKRAALVGGRKAIVRDQRLSDGRTLRISTRSVPPGYRLITWEDVSETRLAEERYDVASRAVNEGIYDWDIKRDKIYYSERVYEALGFTARDYRTVSGWRKRIHPDDLPRFTSGVIAHLKGESERFECDYRFKAKDGRWRWARQHGIALRDAAGRAVRMIGSTGDIDELKLTEEALRQSEERHSLAMRAATEGVYEWDIETGKLYISDTTKVFFWSKAASLTPAAWNERVHRDDYEGYRRALAAHFKGLTPQFEHEYRASNGRGGYLWVLDRGIAVRNAKGRAVRLVGAVSDITDRKHAESQLLRAHQQTKAALEQQTATAEVLRVISSTPSDTQPVFDAIVSSAQRLMSAKSAILLLRRETECFVAAYSAPGLDEIPPEIRRVPLDVASNYPSRVVLNNEVVHLPDWKGDNVIEFERGVARAYGIGSGLQVPLTRKGEGIGVLIAARENSGEFTDKEIALLQSFADQAVIAIENVRLFNETKEALERQTATAEILRVISSTPTNAQPVFDAIVTMAFKLFSCSRSAVLLRQDDHFSSVAVCTRDGVRRSLVVIGDVKIDPVDNFPSRVILDKRLLHLPDWSKVELSVHERRVYDSGTRASLMVPLLREGNCIGVLAFLRGEPIAFDDKEIGLAQSFADQAVIAIENVRLFNETKEALERQTATAEILKVIASSPSDVQPVFDAIATSAMRLVGGLSAAVGRLEGDMIHLAALTSVSPAADDAVRKTFPRPLTHPGQFTMAVRERSPKWIADVEAAAEVPAEIKAMARARGFRSGLAVPMMRGAVAIGAINVTRGSPGAFSDHQLSLLKTFADQAVIAIENVRLFNETKEALERQTATAEILKVIASSPSDAQPVFEAISQSAARLFESRAGIVIREDDSIDLKAAASVDMGADAMKGALAAMRERFPHPFDPERYRVARVIANLEPYEVQDTEASGVPEGVRDIARRGGYRSLVIVPLIREGIGLGALSVTFGQPGVRLTEKQRELLRTFADQAVIAIENVRLFNELEARNREVTQALERQTATSEVLKVISSSPGELEPVFGAMLENATRICEAKFGNVYLFDHGTMRLAATHNTPEAFAKYRTKTPPVPNSQAPIGRMMTAKAVVQVADLASDQSYLDRYPPSVAAVELGGVRTVLAVPLLKDDDLIGGFSIFRQEVRPFTDKQIELMQNFAAQAVIAIENTRLLNETKDALQRQTAAGEVLKVISSSPGDLEPVFQTMLTNATRLCDAAFGNIYRFHGGAMQLVATHNMPPAFVAYRTATPHVRSQAPVGRMMETKALVHVADLAAENSYREGYPPTVAAVELGGIRTLLLVPMLKENELLGAFSLIRREVRPFTEKQIELVASFANQAVIAIENVRLFKELEARTEALGKSVQKLTALGEVSQAISSTLDLEKVLKTIATHAVRLTSLDGASIYEYDESTEEFRLQVADSFPEEFMQSIRGAPIRKGDGGTVGSVAITLEPAQAADINVDTYHSARKELLLRAGYRAVLTVPLLSEDRVIGALSVTRKTPGPFPDEIVELMKTFATQSAMAIQNARLFREIDEKGKQLEVASHHKSQFLASMSHELRTPLNAILGFNEMILDNIYGELSEDLRAPLENMQTSGKHLLRLINNVLDLAKIEAGRMELALSDYSVQDTVASVHSTLKPLAAEKGLDFLANVPDDLPLAYGDGGRIAQCLMNLAGNSLKFTKAGKVEISVEKIEQLLRYRVSDTGIGIPADKIGNLFTEFKQTDATIASEYGGTGLGLSISRKFIEMHGGRIWVESEPGKGSTFLFEIPLRTAI